MEEENVRWKTSDDKDEIITSLKYWRYRYKKLWDEQKVLIEKLYLKKPLTEDDVNNINEVLEELKEKERMKTWNPMSDPKIRAKVTGANSGMWQGGISFLPYSSDWKESLKKYIRERDNYTCAVCNEHGHHVHHIDYDKMYCAETNLITLCGTCHPATNINRKYWQLFFTKIINQKYVEELKVLD